MTSASLATNNKPTLGYSSKGSACLALKAEGKSWGEIGALLKMKPRAASSLAYRARQRAANAVRHIELNALLVYDLDREAKKRNMTVQALVERLVKVAIYDKLFNAILDDEQ